MRKQLKESDYYSYITYELNLEKLREIRSFRLTSQSTAKDRHDLLRNVLTTTMRHISYVFERATRRFPSKLALWSDYIRFLKDKKAKSLLSNVLSRVISLHPKQEDFWIVAATMELETNGNIYAARTLYQRALRMNRTSQSLWMKYFEFELWNFLKLEIQNEKSIPEVVFESAVASISDVTFVCSLLKLSSVNSNLHSRLLDLCSAFSSLPEFWRYRINSTLDSFSPSCSKSPLEMTRTASLVLCSSLECLREAREALPNSTLPLLAASSLSEMFTLLVQRCCPSRLPSLVESESDLMDARLSLDTSLSQVTTFLESLSSLALDKDLPLFEILSQSCSLSTLRLQLSFSLSCQPSETLSSLVRRSSHSLRTSQSLPKPCVFQCSEAWAVLASSVVSLLPRISLLSIGFSADLSLLQQILADCPMAIQSQEAQDLFVLLLTSSEFSSGESETSDLIMKTLCSDLCPPSFQSQLLLLLFGTVPLNTSPKCTFEKFHQKYLNFPQYFVHLDLVPILHSVLSLEEASLLGAGDSPSTFNQRSSFLLTLYRFATEKCPEEASFWERWEALERKLGNFEFSNHLRWKKRKIIQSK